MAKPFRYRGRRTKEISFPLGGIGTGCVGLAGNGRLVDWEIFNRPAKGSTFGFTHFAVRAEAGGKVVDARVLHGDLLPPYTGSFAEGPFGSFGFGPPRGSMAGMPHFRHSEFIGEFPVATVRFGDEHFPGSVSLRAFNPFVPLDAKDSGLPAAFFEVEIENTTSRKLSYTVCFSLKNPFPQKDAANTFRAEGGLSLLTLASRSLPGEDLAFGDLTAATDAADTSFQEYWFRGSWFDNLGVYWQDFRRPGHFRNRDYAAPGQERIAYGKEDLGLLAAHLEARPGTRARARFVLSWSFPNCANYWNPVPEIPEGGRPRPATWRNWYATQFADSRASARYCLSSWDRLWAQTEAFKDALFGSTLPREALDAVSANLSILKSPTVMRLEDGTFYGFEGCHPASGCCEGSCTHVWNYAYALPFLFPELERTVRDADFAHNRAADGGMGFRLQLPLGRPRSSFRACADGQFGGVVKAYREWKISGDTTWLRRHWPAIKANIAFAWAPSNQDHWDADRDGVLEGRQHHTLDMELFGPNSWLTGLYLAALKAGAEMGRHLGDEESAREYEGLFARGKAWVDEHLWNGEYYHQLVDLKDRSILERYAAGDAMTGTTLEAYWDAEHGEIKYQIAEGCAADQVLAQWHANICGLGEIFDPRKTRKALRSIHRHNFRRSVRELANPCRVFALDDEAGLLICSYPRSRPAVTLTYAEEAMHGFEYQAACHMIQEGLVEEGLEVVRGIRARYDGERRNPWNEFECGSNYARSMASYALLPALSGFTFDMTRGSIGFSPVGGPATFRCLWCLQKGWGTFRMTPGRIELALSAGSLRLERFEGRAIAPGAVRSVTVGGVPVAHAVGRGVVELAEPVTLGPGRSLVISRKR
jgi:non-lysosomal glucosylceramidase